MKLVIDASIAIKWVVDEPGTTEALALRRKAKLIAPDLLIAECANILWKKARRKELTAEEARIAARLLQAAELELLPTRALLEKATRFAMDLDHPAYDCLYLAVAVDQNCPLATADVRLLQRLGHAHEPLRGRAISLTEAART